MWGSSATAASDADDADAGFKAGEEDEVEDEAEEDDEVEDEEKENKKEDDAGVTTARWLKKKQPWWLDGTTAKSQANNKSNST